MSPYSLDDLMVFLRVTVRGSFSAAARDLNYTPGAVSKQIARLEQALGVRLFERNTRNVRLTDEGAAVASYARQSATYLERIAEVAASSRGELAGKIRLTAPQAFGRLYVAQAITDFRRQHPAVDFELQLSDRVVDLLHEDIYIAIRIGQLADSGLVARRLGVSRRVLVAAPEYLKAHPVIRHPKDLAAHPCLLFTYPGALQDRWSFSKGRRKEDVSVSGAMRSDNGEVLSAWCAAGFGLALREPWDVQHELNTGRVVRVLTDWEPQPAVLSSVHAPRDPLPRRISAFLEFVSRDCRGFLDYM